MAVVSTGKYQWNAQMYLKEYLFSDTCVCACFRSCVDLICSHPLLPSASTIYPPFLSRDIRRRSSAEGAFFGFCFCWSVNVEDTINRGYESVKGLLGCCTSFFLLFFFLRHFLSCLRTSLHPFVQFRQYSMVQYSMVQYS